MLPNPKQVPLVANFALAVALVGCVALLLGAPVEAVLSVADNPVSRVVVVTFAMAIVGIGALAFAMHLLLHRYRQMEDQLEEMRELVEGAHARTSAMAASADDLEERVDRTIDRIEETMADERERVRDQLRTYVREAEANDADEASQEVNA